MVVFARMVAGHPPLLYTRNEDSKPGCPPQLFNDVGESPCQVAQNLLNPCGQQLADVLAGGTNHTICTCLASACMDCDDEYAQMARIAPFSSWVTDCGSPLRAMYPSSHNKPESQKPNVPSWAYNNLTSGNMFSLAAAVGDVSNPGAGWSPIQIVTPIIVGLGLSILFALFLLYRRHRKNGGKSFHLHVPTFVTSRLYRRRRRVRRYDDLPAVWSVDIDESDEIIPLEQPPRAVAPLRTSSPSSIPRTRANNVRTVPRRVGTLLQSVQRIFGRPIEVLAYTPGAHADIASNDGHEQPGVPGSSGDVIDPSDAAPPVPPKDPTSFWTFLKLSRLTEQLSQTSQKYGPVRSDDDDDDVAIVHFSNSGSESGADRRRGGQATDLPASSRAAGPLQGAPTSSREVDARPGRTTSPSASVSRRPGGPRVQETVREAGDPNDRDSSASPSDTSVSIGKNAAQVAIAPSKLRSDHRGKRKSSGSALGALGAPFGISEVELPGDQEDDPDEHRLLNDAVTESAETEFFPPIMTFPTDSPTDSAALGTGESEKIPWRSRRNLSLANSHESSSAGARSNYSKRTGTSRTGTTFTSSSRDRRSLEGNPPTPAEIDGRRHSMFSYLLSSRHRSLPPAGSLLPPLPPQLQPSNGEGAKRREAKRKAEPPSAFPSTSLAALPIRESSAQAGGTPPLSTPSESPIVFTNETFHTAQAGSSPSGSFMNNGLPTPYASPPCSTPQPLPLPSISSEIPFSAMVDFALSQPSHAMMTPHANPNLVPPPPPLPLLPRLPPQPSTAATTTTTTGTGTTGTFWSDENPLGAPAPPNSSVSESPLAMSPIALSNPHSPRSRTRTRSISPPPSIPPVPLPASPAYSPPASAKSSSFSASQPQSPPASVGKSSTFSPSQAYSPPASVSRPSFHSHSRSADTSSQASARARNISDLHSKSSFHTHSASASASLQASSASGSRVSLHSPPASKSPLHSPQPSHRALPQSPIPSVRPLPSPIQARKQLQQSPSATQTAFHSHSHSPSSSSIALASSSSSSLPRLSNSTLAPSDPRNLIPAHVRGAGYDPYHPIHESRWSSLMDNEE